MSIPKATIERLEALQDDEMSVIIDLVDFFSKSPADIFDEICDE